MSADRWSECPKCADKALTLQRDKEAIEDLYTKGLLSRMASQRMIEALDAQPRGEENLREDWEVYQEAGVLHFSYGCSCTDCGFKFSCKIEKDMGIAE